MTRALELWNLLYADRRLSSEDLNNPANARFLGRQLTINEQVEFITTVGNTSYAQPPAQRALGQLRDGKMYWDADGNIHIRD